MTDKKLVLVAASVLGTAAIELEVAGCSCDLINGWICRIHGTIRQLRGTASGPAHVCPAQEDIATAIRERDEARQWAVDSVRKLEAEQREISCVWCGEKFVTEWSLQKEQLRKHAENCTQNPYTSGQPEPSREALMDLMEAASGLVPYLSVHGFVEDGPFMKALARCTRESGK